MKSLDEMSGVQRVAALLIAIGPDMAAEIIKHLDERDIELISAEIAQTENLTQDEKDELLGEFFVSLKKARLEPEIGRNGAKSILDKAFDTDKSQRIMKKVSAKDLEREFVFFKDADTDVLLKLLQNETPQMLAVILAYFPPSVSAAILKGLPPEKAKTVALRMARLESVAPEAVLDMVVRLKENYKKQQTVRRKNDEAEGMEALSNIISHMTLSQGKKLMENLDMLTPEISQSLRDRAFGFDFVLQMTNREIRTLIDAVNDDYLLAMAFKGADENIKFRFLRNMSSNRAEDVLKEMNRIGAVRKSDAEAARDEVAKIIRLLFESGEIGFRKDGELYAD